MHLLQNPARSNPEVSVCLLREGQGELEVSTKWSFLSVSHILSSHLPSSCYLLFATSRDHWLCSPLESSSALGAGRLLQVGDTTQDVSTEVAWNPVPSVSFLFSLLTWSYLYIIVPGSESFPIILPCPSCSFSSPSCSQEALFSMKTSFKAALRPSQEVVLA